MTNSLTEETHKTVARCLRVSKVKAAIAYASFMEGPRRKIELEIILKWCVDHKRSKDAIKAAEMLNRKLTSEEQKKLLSPFI